MNKLNWKSISEELCVGMGKGKKIESIWFYTYKIKDLNRNGPEDEEVEIPAPVDETTPEYEQDDRGNTRGDSDTYVSETTDDKLDSQGFCEESGGSSDNKQNG